MIVTAQLSNIFEGRATTTEGGFAWWYADLLDASGNGLVLIWSVGLPFLPAFRSGVAALARPSVNLALYRHGREQLYLLQEHPADALEPISVDGATRIGASHFAIERAGRQLTLRATLDEPVPGTTSRLRGSVELTGVTPELALPSETANHVWTPRLLHASGHATLALDGRTEQLAGVGYFDGNASTLPLQAQGIGSWRWARIWIGARTYVVYDISGAAGGTLVLVGGADGSIQPLDAVPRFEALRFGRYGIRSPRSLSLDLGSEQVVCRATALLEDGPFYQRFLLESRVLEGRSRSSHGNASEPVAKRGFGVYEVVYPNRIDRGWQRPFVQMRTHRVGRANSAWLPFFSGWSERRGRRLLASVAERLIGTHRARPSRSVEVEP